MTCFATFSSVWKKTKHVHGLVKSYNKGQNNPFVFRWGVCSRLGIFGVGSMCTSWRRLQIDHIYCTSLPATLLNGRLTRLREKMNYHTEYNRAELVCLTSILVSMMQWCHTQPQDFSWTFLTYSKGHRVSDDIIGQVVAARIPPAGGISISGDISSDG